MAINHALNYKPGSSVSDGNMIVGVSDTHVAVSFNQTPGNLNSVICLQRHDASSLMALLQSILSTP